MTPDFQNQPPGSAPETRRWLMFLLRPTDLLELLRIVSNPLARYAAGAMPPDVRIVDTFYDAEHDLLGAMLESEFFEPVAVQNLEGRITGEWPRALFSLAQTNDAELLGGELWGEDETEAAQEIQSRATVHLVNEVKGAVERGYHLRALNFAGTELLQILRSNSARSLPEFPVYPPDVRLLGAMANPQVRGWTLFLEHSDFEPARVIQDPDQADMVFLELPGDGHDLTFRFGLPGARVERRFIVDEDSLN